MALPEDVKCVDMIAIDRTRIISSVDESWDNWFDGENVTADFMDDREQPSEQRREHV
ncbi:type II toxin-antitoxin system VapB family antitoxin [Erwinia pyrifoliae]|nr:type II toxin-antitoxin system VapB family antitoxin [Erwinia pyrifoliae]UWS31844.1 type II toxin-antitoxin system VapB family antitoxin [Erwinia pyrifoliae]